MFDEDFISPLSMPDLPYQGALRIRNVKSPILNTEVIHEETGPPTGQEEEFPDDLDLPNPPISELMNNDQEVLFCNESCLLYTSPSPRDS